jgi:RNA polymerase sigma-70 factor (ECF subfamily)
MSAAAATAQPPTMTGNGPTSEELWQAAYRTERPALLAFLRRQVRDPGLAEDLVQETFVRAIRSGRVAEDPARLRAYLFTIARHLVVDHWRRPRALPLPEGGEGEGELEIEDRTAESPEAGTRRRFLARRLATAITALPERYRTAFRLAAVEQKSYREIGAATGWTLDQVRVNVHRARRRLIEELGDALA